jgi:hypothetical protein
MRYLVAEIRRTMATLASNTRHLVGSRIVRQQ